MSDLERVTRAKSERDESAYKRGIKEGFDQAKWLAIGLLILILWLISLFPE